VIREKVNRESTTLIPIAQLSETKFTLPSNWVLAQLEEVAANNKNAIVDGPFGSNLKISDYIEDGVPVLTTKNLSHGYTKENLRYISFSKFEELKRSEVKSGDILVAKIGSCGKTGIYPMSMPSAIIPANLLKMTVHDSIEALYVYYFLNSPIFNEELSAIITSTAQPAFNLSKFRQLSIPLAPFAEQQRIVSAIEQQFTRLDAGVAALHRTQVKLKRYRAAVLKAAVEGKLTEAWRAEHPTTEPASMLLERILKERHAKWEDDLRAKGKDPAKMKYVEPAKLDMEALPELPEGWVWVNLGQLTWSVKDGPHYSPKYVSEGIPFITGGNVRP
jgi:type I restriction enzyme, S subunit